jgi:hypothetical protein
MVAPRYPLQVVFWPIVASPTPPTRLARSRDLVPGADPYIAMLIRKLQDEVRTERTAGRWDAAQDDSSRIEASPFDFDEPLDFEFPDGPAWTHDDPPPSQPR